MDVYLPIAGTAVNLLVLLGIGGGVGLLSGLFGVGGGFLLTPLLILIGIPPAVAVGSGANQVVASSVSGLLAHWRRGNVDVRMGLVLIAGGIPGSLIGVLLFALLRRLGQVELVVSICYVALLGTLGMIMMGEGVSTYIRRRHKPAERGRLHKHYLLHRLPLKLRFRRSRLYISALLPAGLGFVVGLLTSIMGVGGGFLAVPAMVYLIGMPTAVVIGTSLLQITIVGAGVTFMQATTNQNVDVLLVLFLVVGGVIGAQVGAKLGARLRGEQLRILLALIVLGVCAQVAFRMTVTPDSLYSFGAG